MILDTSLLQIGLITGISLAIILFLGFGAFAGLFSADAEVLEIARSGLFVRICYLNNWLFGFIPFQSMLKKLYNGDLWMTWSGPLPLNFLIFRINFHHVKYLLGRYRILPKNSLLMCFAFDWYLQHHCCRVYHPEVGGMNS